MGDSNGGGSGPPKFSFGGFGSGTPTSSPGFALGGAQAGDKPSPFSGFGGGTPTASPFGTPAISFGGAPSAAKPAFGFGAAAATTPGGDATPKPAFGFGGAGSKPLFGLGSTTPSSGSFGAAAKQQDEPKPMFGSGLAMPERALATVAPARSVSAQVAESTEVIKPTLKFMEYEPKESAVWIVPIAMVIFAG